MANTQTLRFSAIRCEPVYNPEDALQISVPLAPGNYAAGTILGQISGANTDDVQTITVSGSPTHSTLTLFGLPGGLTYTPAQDVAPAALTTALNTLLGAGSVAVTGTYVAGSGGTYILTWGGTYANQPMPLLSVTAVFTGGTSPAVTIAHTTTGIGPNGSYGVYASTHTDGTQNAAGILEYPAFVNAAGQIFVTLSDAPVSEFGQYDLSAPMFYSGDFDYATLTGLDSTALTALLGRFVTGSLSAGAGVVHIG